MLLDLISDEPGAGLAETTRFSSVVGGAPTNTALTAARLGASVAAVGCTGPNGLGHRIARELDLAGVTPMVVESDRPTTLAMVGRTTGTPEFVIIRGADRYLAGIDLPPGRWMHTSLFALSEDPQRSFIMEALSAFEGRTSLDANYHCSVWGDRPALPTLEALGGAIDVLKASADDCVRLFGNGLPSEWIDQLVNLGYETVLLTNGGQSVVVHHDDATSEILVPPRNVIDVTGAGDAFMAGAIMGRLDGFDWPDAAAAGVEVAGRKVEVVGHLPQVLDRQSIYAAAVA